MMACIELICVSAQHECGAEIISHPPRVWAVPMACRVRVCRLRHCLRLRHGNGDVMSRFYFGFIRGESMIHWPRPLGISINDPEHQLSEIDITCISLLYDGALLSQTEYRWALLDCSLDVLGSLSTWTFPVPVWTPQAMLVIVQWSPMWSLSLLLSMTGSGLSSTQYVRSLFLFRLESIHNQRWVQQFHFGLLR